MMHLAISVPYRHPHEAAMSRKRSKYPAKHCRTCGTEINRSSRGQCKPCSVIGLRRACPEDFLTVLRKLGSQGAARHYHASLATVTRWRRERGLTPQLRMMRSSRPTGTTGHLSRGFTPRPMIQHRDMTTAGMAAEFLRRYGSVYRCDPDGTPNSKGTHWRRFLNVVTDEDLIARAKKLGWNEVVW